MRLMRLFVKHIFSATNRTFSNRVQVWNEWDPLEEIVVGVPTNSVVPPFTVETKGCIDSQYWQFFQENSGRKWSDALGAKFWDNVLREQEGLVTTLKKHNVEVRFPEPMNFAEPYRLPNDNKDITGFGCVMPRDILLVVGNEIIEAPMTWKSRYFEFHSYRKLIYEYWKSGCEWTVAPKPVYTSLFKSEENENITSNKEGSKEDIDNFVTTNSEICFDAADFVKLGKDLLAQRSQVTNEIGIEWVRRHLRPKGIRVVQVSFDQSRPMHIDGTIIPLKPGLLLTSKVRPCHQAAMLESAGWTLLKCPQRKETGPPYYLGSTGLTLNLLSLSPNLIIVEESDTELQKFLRSHNIEVIPLPFRHCNSMGGSFHCWTIDIRRRGTLQNYFDWPNGFIQ